jgi:non-lysosomal glucosylceramidase
MEPEQPDSPAEPERVRDLSRREFLVTGGAAAALSLVESRDCCAAPTEKYGTHHVPEDKNLAESWVSGLFARGQSKVYRGEELTCVGMPIGGICVGQLYLRGDGTLADWHIFNHEHFTGYGENSYRTYTPWAPLNQGFALWVKSPTGEPIWRTLDRDGFPNVEFTGEYPIGKVRYAPAKGDALPVEVTLEAFSPFIPLNAKESALPVTVLRFHLRNTSAQALDVWLDGWLQNAVCQRHAGRVRGLGRNSLVERPGMSCLVLSAEETAPAHHMQVEVPEVFADFESGTYGAWKTTGTAFGDGPAAGAFPHQQRVTGYGGKYLVNSYRGDDKLTGTLTSPEFTLRRPYVYFRIGGGNHPGKACINLLVDGKPVRTATGKNNEKLEWDYWEVSDLQGKQARIEIVDRATGPWGHINVDDIEFADTPPKEVHRALKDQPDFGTLALCLLGGDKVLCQLDRASGGLNPHGTKREPTGTTKSTTFPLGEKRTGDIGTQFTLPPNGSKEVVFLVTWHFAGAKNGRFYGRSFADAVAVAEYVRDNLDRLSRQTRLFHDTYYDSTLPHWLLDRIMMPVSTLATDTCQWWANGRFWAWEGVGCCEGTCTHVWNYAQAMARLFPELERSARTKQDLGPAFDPKTGRVGFRGEDPNSPYAADGQCGTVLKCYREHLTSRDGAFLKEHWPRIKKVMEYAIARDGNADGILEDKQWNTFDLDFVGPNTFVGALYLAALEAAARMADLQGDHAFAAACRAIAVKGGKWTSDHLWNGEYFVQRIPERAATKHQYGVGCLSDQLLGQNWANQLGLGYLYPPAQIRTALKSIYRYNWAPDIAVQNKAHPPDRWFARPGEAGLFVCTWPKGDRMREPVLYRDEVWTGGEYQVAAHLLYEGMIREGLSVIRGIHDRYDGRHHNPWNEVECGDHYARALASWGCLLGITGFEYDGPAGRLAFAPRHQIDDFRAFFSAAEAWGTLVQRRSTRSQENLVAVKYGELTLSELKLEVPSKVNAVEANALLGSNHIKTTFAQEGRGVTVTFQTPLTIDEHRALRATIRW